MAIAFQFKSNVADVNRRMSNMVARQMPFAISKALNDTAKSLVAKNKQDMGRIFDRPVPWTLNAFTYKPARKYENTVTIRRKDMQRKRHYLEVQNEGGLRGQTGMERAFQMNLPYGGILQHVTPTKATRLNKHGNMSPGFRNQMMSAMRVSSDPKMRSPVKGQTRSGGAKYFVPNIDHPLGQGSKAGVYQRMSKGRLRKVLNFIDRGIAYRPKLRFEERMALYGSNIYKKRLSASLKYAMATAKLR